MNEPNRPDKRFITPAEAARVLGLSHTKIYEMLGTGKLASVKLGDKRNSARLIPCSAIDALEQSAFRAASARAGTLTQD